MLEKYSVSDFLQLRKKRIAMEFKNLNDMQYKAAMHTEGPLLLLAGAGSGKTTVLINRIANIIKYGCAYTSEDVPPFLSDADCEFLEDFISNPDVNRASMADQICSVRPAAPWSIIAITFTNKAAKELKERLERAIGDQANDVWAATFHSACVRILRQNIDKLGFDKSFTIYDTTDSEKVMKETIKYLNVDEKTFSAKVVLNVIGRAKDSMKTPDVFAEEAKSDFRLAQIAKLYCEYQKRLRNANALDFDDIIMHTVMLLRDFADVREYYQNKFRYVLIDEYQDTNHAQYLLASLLAGKHGNICVVGDDDQSIYRFRGATIENILQFENQYENAVTIRLEQNYRSTKNILDVANNVIANNKGRKSKKLWTDNTSGTLPELYCAANEADEANYIAKTMLDGYASGKKWRDYAVLYRINAQSNQIETAFKRNGIPYRIIGGLKFFDRAEVKDMLSYLWVIHNPTDELRLKRIINVPSRKIGAATIEKAENIARGKGVGLFDVIKNANEYKELSKSAAQLTGFASLICNMQKLAEDKPISEMYETLVNSVGYVEMLISKNDEDAKNRIENIQELKSTLLEFESRNSENATLGAFLDEISLFTDIENYDQEADAVVMMTIHSAKGLEFPTVFLCGVEEGLFPGVRSLGIDEEIEEERRLFYVAATRARQQLHISNAASRMLFGQTSYNRPSRFVEEIPKELLQIKYSETVNVIKQGTSGASESYFKPKSRNTAYASSMSFGAKTTEKESTLNAGDRVIHKSFGKGIVVTARAVGGDVLLEIAFDDVGTKRLMYKSAAQYLKKEI